MRFLKKRIQSAFTFNILRRSLLYFLPLIVVFGIIFSFFCYNDIQEQRELIRLKASHIVKSRLETFIHELDVITSDLMFLSEMNEVENLFENPENMKKVERESISFLKRRKVYDQVRILDNNGQEVVRVNFNDGKPEPVPKKKLQSKAQRYYFYESSKLGKNEVFVSPLDLNMERGRIEIPYKPVIRFMTPIFDSSGKKQGLFILNYLGQNLFRFLHESTDQNFGKILLVNSKSFFLQGLLPEDEWGFMRKEGSEKVFNEVFPGAWNKILKQDENEFYTDKGLLAFNTLYLLKSIIRSRTGISSAFGSIGSGKNIQDFFWKIVYFVPKAVLWQNAIRTIKIFVLLYSLFFLVFGAACFFLANAVERRKKSEKLGEIKNTLISATFHISEKLDLKSSLKQTLSMARSLSNSRYAALAVIKENKTEQFLYEGLDGEEEEKMKQRMPCPPEGKGLLGLIVREKRPLRISDISQHSESCGFPEGHIPMKSFLGIPILYGKEPVGMIHLTEKIGKKEFTLQDEEVIKALANHAAVAIRNASLYERVKSFNKELEQKVNIRTKELREALKLAESANRAKSDFLANMSHELRTPLSAIIGFSEALKDGMAGPVNEKQMVALQDIYESGKHLLNLISDILDLSKVEAGKLEMDIEQFDMKELLEKSLSLFREKAEKHNIATEADISPDIGLVKADQRKIKQVVFNLLSNAFKFTPDGGKVRIEAGSREDMLEVSVIDTGIGISKENIKKLFQPFTQLETTLTKNHPGTGLGLNLSRKLVELHSGRIRAESEEGKGSKFTFSIPLKGKVNA